MIRGIELALFAAPFALYFLWRRFVVSGQVPTRTALGIMVSALLVLGGALAWSGLRERHPEGTHYVPAEMRDGQVVPGHGT